MLLIYIYIYICMYVCMYVSVVNAFFLCLPDPMYFSRVPGVAFKNKIPFIELKEFELQRSATTDAQRRFYQVITLTRRKELHPVDLSINSIWSAIDIYIPLFLILSQEARIKVCLLSSLQDNKSRCFISFTAM